MIERLAKRAYSNEQNSQNRLARVNFVLQSKPVNANWAEENLKTIRCLMEQASLYRRAMAPLALLVGALGVVAAGIAQLIGWVGPEYFAGYWLGVAVVSALCALVLIRRQALKTEEAFWSPPTKRVAQAMFPMLTVGLCLGVLEVLNQPESKDSIRLAAFWLVMYGGALHSAGFFMRRGINLLSWIYVFLGCLTFFLIKFEIIPALGEHSAHWLMGVVFGGVNLAYGVYLKLTPEPLEME